MRRETVNRYRADELERQNKTTGLVTMCIGGGMGTTIINGSNLLVLSNTMLSYKFRQNTRFCATGGLSAGAAVKGTSLTNAT